MKNLAFTFLFLPSILFAQNMTDSAARNKYLPIINFGLGYSFRNLDKLENTFSTIGVPNVGPRGTSFSVELIQNPYFNSAVTMAGLSIAQWEGNTNTFYTRFRSTSWYIGAGFRAWKKGRFLLMPSLQFGAQSFQINIDEFKNQTPMKLADFLSAQSPTNYASITSKIMMGIETAFYYKLGETFTLGIRTYYQYRFGKSQWEGFMGRNLDGPKMNRHLLACEIGFSMVWN